MEKFLNKKVVITTTMGDLRMFVGTVSSYDDEYVCLDNNLYVVRKFICAIQIK